MKKLISLLLALAMVMSLSVTVFAAEGDVTGAKAGEYSANVTGSYVPGIESTGTVFSVDISWTAMSFTYHAEQAPVWDATNHKYSESTPAKWEGEGTITVTNHSNAKITAVPAYTPGAGYESANMNFGTDELKIASAESGSEQVGTITVTPTGSLPKMDAAATIGSIKVTIAEDTTTTPLEEAQQLQSDIQATYDQIKGQGNDDVEIQLGNCVEAMEVMVNDAETFQNTSSWDGTSSESYDRWCENMQAVRSAYEDVLDDLGMA